VCGYERGCSCGCGHHRRYYTAEERRDHLKRYAEGLEKELEAVREKLIEIEG